MVGNVGGTEEEDVISVVMDVISLVSDVGAAENDDGIALVVDFLDDDVI